MSLIGIELFYVIGGCFLLAVGGRVAADRGHPHRWTSALFWILLGVSFLFGRTIPPTAMGYLILAMTLLAATGGVGHPRERTTTRAERLESAERLRNRLLWPALLIPVTAVAGSLFLNRIHWRGFALLDPANLTITAISLGALLALAAGLRVTRAPALAPVSEGSRLLQTVGWAVILPQLLAALGGLFVRAGVGTVVADFVGGVLPTQHPFVAVAAYCFGMLLFTVCLGNAFAAFAVITGGIGLPLIVQQHGGNPAIMAAVGMLSGYCGTLMTPMAANFNIVPAMLLELEDKNAVIRAQLPVALAVFAFNLLLMQVCVYRF